MTVVCFALRRMSRTVVTLYSVDLARPIVLMACSEPRNWFTALARHNGPQVVTITLVDDLLSECGENR